MPKIYELTDKHYEKIYVVGVNSDEEAEALAKRVFKKYYWEGGISFYDRTESAKKRGVKKYWMTKSEFLKLGWRYK